MSRSRSSHPPEDPAKAPAGAPPRRPSTSMPPPARATMPHSIPATRPASATTQSLPAVRPSLPPSSSPPAADSPASLEANADRGADNLAARCLALRVAEVVRVFTWQADGVYGVVARAIARAGARIVRVELEPLARDPSRAPAALAAALDGATASLFLSGGDAPTALSVAVVQAATRAGTRHLHVPSLELRVLAQSARAEPAVLARTNGRLAALLRAPARVRATSDCGTDLEVGLTAQYPLYAMDGRPAPGRTDNLPSGAVYVHPGQANGVFVADRALRAGGARLAGAALRRAPVRLTITDGRVTDVACTDEAMRDVVVSYLASHAHAGRVGLVSFPTNYLVRSEIGSDYQDMLLPGMNLFLGFSHATLTRAPFDAPVQLLALARRMTVEVGGVRVVDAGRFDDKLVDGIDPFR